MKKLVNFLQRHTVLVVFLLSAVITVTFYYDVAFLGKTMLSPGGLTAGVMGDAGAYGDTNPLPPDFTQFAAYMKDLGSNAWAGEPQTLKAGQAVRNWDLPLWNDNAAVGKPLAANFLSTAFYPLKLIIYAIPNVNGWEIYLLARFMVGVFFMFLFLRELKVKTIPAVIASVVFAFSGYFVMLQNIQNMDADLLTPMMFWIVARAMNLAKEEKVLWHQYAVLVGALVVVFLSNVPESLFLILAAGFIFWAYRLLALYRREKALFKKSFTLFLQIVIPTMLIVLPLYAINAEFVLNAMTMHESEHSVGSAVYIQPDFVAYYVLPFIQSTSLLSPDRPADANTLNYFGIAGYFLVWLGAILAIQQRGTRLFLFVLGVITLAKIHGIPVINEVIGNAPGFDRIMYMKYAQPILSLCVAALVAFGIEGLWMKTVKAWHICLAIFGGFGVLYLGIGMLPGVTVSSRNWSILAIYFAILLVIGLFLTSPLKFKGRATLAAVTGLMVIAELWIFVPHNGRPDRYETMTKPPFVTFLQSRPQPYRIYAYDGLLYPSISSSFNLDDIRDLDGLFVDHYYKYVRYFISHTVIDRFTGKKSGPGESKPAKIVNNPFIDILNVRYLIAEAPPIEFFPENEINNAFFAVNPATPSIRETVFDIKADTRRVLFEHSPSQVCAPVPVTKEKPMLRFSVGIDEQAWQYGGADGVQMVMTDENNNKLLFERKIDPVNVVSDQAWFEHAVNLSAYAGTSPTLCLHTNPIGTTVADWAGWADFRLTPLDSDVANKTDVPVKLIYRGTDAYVYENTNALDRVFTVGRVTSFATQEEVIKYMRKSGFDPSAEAVVLTAAKQPALPPLDGDACAHEMVKNYQERKSSLVSVDVFSPGDCLLVWSDTDYPGWKAYVDGHEVPIYNTDLMLRGIVLNQGLHHIVMQYRPVSFYGSLIATAVGLILTTYWTVRFARKRKTKGVSSNS